VDIPDCHCTTDLDCLGKGGTCGLFQISFDNVTTLCRNPVGPNLAGEPCQQHVDCMTGYCLEFDDGDICFGGCKSNLDCKGVSECGEVNFQLPGDFVVSIPTCVHPADECFGDKDCPGDDVCLPVLNPDVPGTLMTACINKQGAKAAGADCTGDGECASGVCFNLFEKGPNKNICWSSCKQDVDCANGLACYYNLIYFIFDQGTGDTTDDTYWGMPGCAPYLGSYQLCQGDSDCPATEYCHTYNNQTVTDLEPKCITSTGNLQAGANCSSNSECKSNWCHNFGISQACIGLCKGNDECFGETTCQQTDMTINNKGDENEANDVVVDVLLCVPVVGG